MGPGLGLAGFSHLHEHLKRSSSGSALLAPSPHSLLQVKGRGQEMLGGSIRSRTASARRKGGCGGPGSLAIFSPKPGHRPAGWVGARKGDDSAGANVCAEGVETVKGARREALERSASRAQDSPRKVEIAAPPELLPSLPGVIETGAGESLSQTARPASRARHNGRFLPPPGQESPATPSFSRLGEGHI